MQEVKILDIKGSNYKIIDIDFKNMWDRVFKNLEEQGWKGVFKSDYTAIYTRNTQNVDSRVQSRPD